MSLLSVAGAKRVAIELNSLSKSHNMAGWRVGMLTGARERINEVLLFKTNMDSGMFLPIQLAAAKALSLGDDWFQQLNQAYDSRRKMVFQLLHLLQCSFEENQAGMFVWAAIPPKYAGSFELCDLVLQEAGVFITPGGIFGSAGNKYVRISLCSPVEKIEEGTIRIQKMVEKFVDV